jgi:3-oxoacyl-[acyl-carrier-protein] synthase I
MPAASALITGVGACTPLGRDAWSSAAAARAGICGFREHPFMIDSVGEPMRAAPAPWLDVGIQGVARYAQLLLPAVDQALGDVPAPASTGLALALPSPRPGLPADLGESLRRVLAERYGAGLSKVLVFERGHAAALLALDAATQAVAAGTLQACIVAAVDSYLCRETLEWLEACDQLHGAGALNNAWGFIPGEAACALRIERREAGRAALAEVVGIGLGVENELIRGESVCIGAGLTAAFRASLAGLPAGARIDDVYCDLNGEAYRADEYGFTALRTKERFRAATDFVAPADCWGDVGAAGGALHALLALAACRKGYAHGPWAMVWASSEGGDRAAAILHAPLANRE